MDQVLEYKTSNVLDNLVLYVSTGMFTLIVSLAALQVLLRNLGIPLVGPLTMTEPVARFFLVIGTFFGAAVASRSGHHIRMDLLDTRVRKLDSRSYYVLIALRNVVILGFTVILLRSTLGNMFSQWDARVVGLSYANVGLLYLGISIGVAAMLVFELMNTTTAIRNIRDWNG